MTLIALIIICLIFFPVIGGVLKIAGYIIGFLVKAFFWCIGGLLNVVIWAIALYIFFFVIL